MAGFNEVIITINQNRFYDSTFIDFAAWSQPPDIQGDKYIETAVRQ